MTGPGAGARGWGLEGKTVLVLGVSDETSIAWSIARAFHGQGARVHIGYQQKFLSRVRLLLGRYPGIGAGRCDVLVEEELEAFFSPFREDGVSVLVHAIAYGPPEIFTGDPSSVSPEAFSRTLDVSAFSLCRLVRHAKPFLRDQASVMALTFQASTRAEPFYGLMGVAKSALESLVRYLAVELGPLRVRVNGISPGPIETLAALGIVQALMGDPEGLARRPGRLIQTAIDAARLDETAAGDEIALARAAWKHVQRQYAERCAIRETISQEDVADCALFLGSDYSKKITGQVIHVDCGLSSSQIL